MRSHPEKINLKFLIAIAICLTPIVFLWPFDTEGMLSFTWPTASVLARAFLLALTTPLFALSCFTRDQPFGSGLSFEADNTCQMMMSGLKLYAFVGAILAGILLILFLVWLVWWLNQPGPYVHPATRSIERANLNEFEQIIRTMKYQDERERQLWHSLSLGAKEKYRERYEERARQAEILAKMAKAQKEAVEKEIGLGDTALEAEALRRFRSKL
jgi:hypothetical protein